MNAGGSEPLAFFVKERDAGEDSRVEARYDELHDVRIVLLESEAEVIVVSFGQKRAGSALAQLEFLGLLEGVVRFVFITLGRREICLERVACAGTGGTGRVPRQAIVYVAGRHEQKIIAAAERLQQDRGLSLFPFHAANLALGLVVETQEGMDRVGQPLQLGAEPATLAFGNAELEIIQVAGRVEGGRDFLAQRQRRSLGEGVVRLEAVAGIEKLDLQIDGQSRAIDIVPFPDILPLILPRSEFQLIFAGLGDRHGPEQRPAWGGTLRRVLRMNGGNQSDVFRHVGGADAQLADAGSGHVDAEEIAVAGREDPELVRLAQGDRLGLGQRVIGFEWIGHLFCAGQKAIGAARFAGVAPVPSFEFLVVAVVHFEEIVTGPQIGVEQHTASGSGILLNQNVARFIRELGDQTDGRRGPGHLDRHSCGHVQAQAIKVAITAREDGRLDFLVPRQRRRLVAGVVRLEDIDPVRRFLFWTAGLRHKQAGTDEETHKDGKNEQKLRVVLHDASSQGRGAGCRRAERREPPDGTTGGSRRSARWPLATPYFLTLNGTITSWAPLPARSRTNRAMTCGPEVWAGNTISMMPAW